MNYIYKNFEPINCKLVSYHVQYTGIEDQKYN
jgi:hypothetical protein